MAKVNRLNRFVNRKNDFIRLYTAGVKFIEVDGNSRLLIAKDLVSYAGLSGDLVLSSAVNMIEIWDKQAYEASLNDPSIDFGTLAEDVMGQLDEPGEGIS